MAIDQARKVIGALPGARLSDLDLYADLLDRSRKLEELVVC